MHNGNTTNTGATRDIKVSTGVESNILDDDYSFVRLIGHLGNDLTVVNAARVSYGAKSDGLNQKDVSLIHYLAKHNHTSPFRHVQLQFHVSTPIFIARQWYKHVVGAGFTDHAWNEISGRYTKSKLQFYIPKSIKGDSKDNKQGSEDNLNKFTKTLAHTYFDYGIKQAVDMYNHLLELGVAREQARAVLPLSMYTEYYWTVSLQAVVNFIQLRTHKGAQDEIQKYAEAVRRLCMSVAPISTEALMTVKEL